MFMLIEDHGEFYPTAKVRSNNIFEYDEENGTETCDLFYVSIVCLPSFKGTMFNDIIRTLTKKGINITAVKVNPTGADECEFRFEIEPVDISVVKELFVSNDYDNKEVLSVCL